MGGEWRGKKRAKRVNGRYMGISIAPAAAGRYHALRVVYSNR
jgi:hypothetical protein